MASKTMESEKTMTFEQNGNGLGPKVVETIAKAFIDQEEKRHNHVDSARIAKWSVPANETIVEREIREQRERENALARQRAAATRQRKAATETQTIQEQNDLKNDLKSDSKNDLKNDLKSDSKNDLKNDLKSDSKNDLKNDLKSGLKNDLKSDLKKDFKNDLKNDTWAKNIIVENKCAAKTVGHLPIRGAHITLELHKMSDNEEQNSTEDLNNTRKDNLVKTPDSGSFGSSERENSLENLNNDFYLHCNTKDSWQSDSSQNVDSSPPQTRDFDSSISALSADYGSNTSQEFHSSRSIVVKPLSEPEDDASSYIRWQKETPIEREIRLAREREEELRREKGLPPLPANNAPSAIRKSEVQKIANRRSTALNDCRSVQHRIATSRIQQEINEATEREKELHAAGLIQTISEDTVDSKVTRFTDLAGFAIEERERKLRRAVSTSSVAAEPESPLVVSSTPFNGQKSSFFRTPIESTSNHFTSSTPVSSKKFGPRVGHKGVMQRFLASRGKVNPINAYRKPNPFTTASYSPVVSPSLSSKEVGPKIDLAEQQILDDSGRKNARRGYLSAEEKIQAELQEMQKREEELRLQRAKIFAQSQPNLLSIGDFEEGESNHVGEGLYTSSSPGNNESNSHSENSRDADGESSFTEVV